MEGEGGACCAELSDADNGRSEGGVGIGKVAGGVGGLSGVAVVTKIGVGGRIGGRLGG